MEAARGRGREEVEDESAEEGLCAGTEVEAEREEEGPVVLLAVEAETEEERPEGTLGFLLTAGREAAGAPPAGPAPTLRYRRMTGVMGAVNLIRSSVSL